MPSKVDRNRELLDQRATRVVYKEVHGAELDAYVFYPEGHEVTDRRCCVLFFFGSKWDNGLVSQFAPQCVYFAARGAVAIAVDYRVLARHGSDPHEAMADAKSAIRWVRQNASALGVNVDRIVAGGASGGAQMALAAAMIDGNDEADEDEGVSAAPNAMILYSPAVDVTASGFGFERFGENKAAKKAAKKASPIRWVRKGLPPSVIFHGTMDRVVPVAGVRKFCRKMRWRRNACELIEFEGQGHGFFNFNVDPRSYEATISSADRFLVDLGFLEAGEDPSDGSALD